MDEAYLTRIIAFLLDEIVNMDVPNPRRVTPEVRKLIRRLIDGRVRAVDVICMLNAQGILTPNTLHYQI